MRQFFHCLSLTLSLSLAASSSFAQSFQFKHKWVDSVYSSLNETERIGQLFMVAAYSGGENYNQDQIEKLLKANQIGGLIFMQGTGEAQAKLTNKYQRMAKLQLLIGMDAEWGLGMRLTGVKNFPRQMMLGATKDTALMFDMASAIADQCRRLGVHFNFAPVIDINTNPKNPVINFRSFGQEKELVARMGKAYMLGLQNNGVFACAKHFPGHGDVTVDSHLDLPTINKSRAQLDENEFYPFKELIKAGVKSVMIAHLSIPSLEPGKNKPTTLSKNVVTDVLQNDLGFGGLIFTDALNMKGLTKYYPDGETDLQAFMAGNDVLLFSQNVPLAIGKIQWAVKTGKIPEAELERRVKKILAAKYEAGLWKRTLIKENNVTADLNKQTDSYKEKVARAAITLVRDHNGAVKKLKRNPGSFAYINLNGAKPGQLHAQLSKSYADLKTFNVGPKTSATETKTLAGKLKANDMIVIGIHDLPLYPGKNGNYGLTAAQILFLQQMSQQKNTVFVLLGNAYAMKYLCNAGSVIVGYEDDIFTEEAAFEVLMDKLPAKGNLPVTICK